MIDVDRAIPAADGASADDFRSECLARMDRSGRRPMKLTDRIPAPGRVPVALDAPVREDLVARVRAEIEAGVYETPERIDATVDRLVSVLFPDL